MPVTIKPAAHASRKWLASGSGASSANGLLQQACPAEHRKCKEIFQSSFDEFSTEAPIYPSRNGFVYAAITAYSSHHHLIIRPEDVWFSILTQLGFFINSHAEEVRGFFVAHEGQKELEIIDIGTIHTINFGAMALKMTHMIAKNVIDPELRTWIMPAFSTTTESDNVVAAVLMMGAMQRYFSYKVSLRCGIPSVTLLGIRADWEEMLKRLEMLPRLGPEPAQFYALLKPVLQNFVMSFDSPTDPAVVEFWSKVAHQSGGSGPHYLSGWITAFCFWKPDGKCLYSSPKGPIQPGGFSPRYLGCNLDGTLYHKVNTDNIPDGHAAVPVTVDDNGRLYETRMVAGSVGICVTSSGDILDEGRGHNNNRRFTCSPNGELVPYDMEPQPGQFPGLDSLQPVSGWWLYEVAEAPKGGNGEKKRLEAYLEDSEDLKLSRKNTDTATSNLLLREKVGA
jgi:hypothetical protein